MEKVMIVARTADFSDQWCQKLRGPIAAKLLDLGLPGVVVNVRDEPVRDSMMTLTTLDPCGSGRHQPVDPAVLR